MKNQQGSHEIKDMLSLNPFVQILTFVLELSKKAPNPLILTIPKMLSHYQLVRKPRLDRARDLEITRAKM